MNKVKIILVFGAVLAFFVIIILVVRLLPVAPLKVIAFLPADGASDIGLSPTISATFSRGVSSEEQKQIFFFSEPLIKGAIEWSGDKKTIILKPGGALKVEQLYRLEINYSQKKFAWSFSTKKGEQLTQEEQITIQAEADRNYGEAQKEILEKYPWFLKLPILTAQYFVYFDVEKKMFFAKLYAADQKLIQSLKDDVLSALKEREIDTTIYPISWIKSP